MSTTAIIVDVDDRDPAGRSYGCKAHDRTLDGTLDLHPAKLMGDSAYEQTEPCSAGWSISTASNRM